VIEEYRDIQGFFNFKELYVRMMDKAAEMDRPFVEVGVWCGRSLLFGAEYAQKNHPGYRKLIGVDIFREMEQAIVNPPFDAFGDRASLFSTLDSRERYALEEYAHIIIGKSVDTAPLFPDGSLACVFIDAAHDYDSVLADLRAWTPKVSKVLYNGIIAGHDYDHPPVRQAVDEFFGGKAVQDGACWIGTLDVS
jgi:cephalosporin hydroxylase